MEEDAPTRDRDIWIREVISNICPLISTQSWFNKGETPAWVSAYRVYYAPSEYRAPPQSGSPKNALMASFGEVSAALFHWNAPYARIEPNLIQTPDNKLNFEVAPLNIQWTGGGVLLLLFTPLPAEHNGNDEDVAREKTLFVRSFMVALMGVNVAYKQEFDAIVQCAKRSVSSGSPVIETPPDETPEINQDGMNLVNVALQKLYSLDEESQNRVRLALRWYQRSLGDDRLAKNTIEEQIDSFINSWLALETLVLERNSGIAPIKNILSEIHGLDSQQIGELFPIGRIFGLRGRILHEGNMEDFDLSLIRFLRDVFSDLLLHKLSLSSGKNTRKYLDGSASSLL